MDPKEKEILQRTFEYVRENNKILRSLRRSAHLAGFLRILYWLIILGGAVLIYKYLEPFIGTLTSLFQSPGNLEGLRESLKSGILSIPN